MSKKVKSPFGCPEVDLSKVSTVCECDYAGPPPPVKTLYVRRKKNGQVQVKINDGKWINAIYDEAKRTLSYYR